MASMAYKLTAITGIHLKIKALRPNTTDFLEYSKGMEEYIRKCAKELGMSVTIRNNGNLIKVWRLS